ncbi:hypothetical protein ABEV34_19995 [Methylorubrum rhodesianum]|uniref:hypothetical protein n=1 Tax=Methylorubrum rhodesianum TaxID=29427 RepID=UPI003D2BDB7A
MGSYERAATGRVRSTWGAETELSYGLAPNLDVRIGQTGAYGNLDVRRRLETVSSDVGGDSSEQERATLGGTARLGALYQLTDETTSMPIVGLLGRVRSLYGPGGTAYETEATALFGKTLIGGARPLGVNLNVGTVYRFDPAPGERATRYLVNASAGQALTRDTALVITYAREQQEKGQPDYSLVQVGVRHRLRDQRAILGAGVGFELNRNTPQFQSGPCNAARLAVRPSSSASIRPLTGWCLVRNSLAAGLAGLIFTAPEDQSGKAGSSIFSLPRRLCQPAP